MPASPDAPAAPPARSEPGLPKNLVPLERRLAWAEGFLVSFVSCDVPRESRRIAQLLSDRLAAAGRRAEVLTIEPGQLDLHAQLVAARRKLPDVAVFLVLGFDRSIPADVDHPPSLVKLNMKRERFSELGCAVVLFLPDATITQLARQAPDFWAWRSGVFRIELTPPEIVRLLSRVAASASAPVGELTPRLRDDHIRTLEGLLGHLGEDQAAERVETSSRLARLLAEAGRFEEAARRADDAVKRARDAAEKAGSARRELLARALFEKAGVASRASRPSAAAEAAQQSAGIWRELTGANGFLYRPWLAVALQAQAVALSQLGRHDEAIAAAREAVDVAGEHDEAAGPRGVSVVAGAAASTLAAALFADGRNQEAAKVVEESIETLRSVDPERPGSSLGELAKSLGLKAAIEASLGDTRSAIATAREAVRARRAARAPAPEIALTAQRLGLTLATAGRWEEALEAIDEADKTAGWSEQGPWLRVAQLASYALVLAELGRVGEAFKRGEEALAILRPLAEREPDAYEEPLRALERWLAELRADGTASGS